MIVAQTTTGRPSEGGHWYDRNGNPVYEIEAAKGGLRPVTLRDARKLNLLPGFSSIAQMEYRPALERWKIEQALMAALTLPRLPDEDDGAFLERARTDSQEQARKAAERGTVIHAAVQGAYEGRAISTEFFPYVTPVRDFLAKRFPHLVQLGEWRAEECFAHEMGYGGKADLLHTDVVVDVKCKDFGEDKDGLALAWPEHCMQLAAYAQGFGITDPTCVNVFVSTRIPGLIRIREWDKAEVDSAWEAFKCLLKLWQIRRNYFPGFSREKAA